MRVCVAPQEASGKVAGTPGSDSPNSVKVRMQMEFPADYTEVTPAGVDKDRKTSPVLCHITLICRSDGANGLAEFNR